MSSNSIFSKTVTKSFEWVQEVMNELETQDERRALRALRAGLHALRDRLPDAEVIDLGAQLPMLLRGLYYEGWQPGETILARTRADYLDLVRSHLQDDSLAPEDVVRAVFRVLAWRITDGELNDIVSTLPKPVAQIWGESCT